MIPDALAKKLKRQADANPHVLRDTDQRTLAAKALRDLQLSQADEIGEFFFTYCMDAIEPASGVSVVLVDLCSPSRQSAESTEYVHSAYGVSADYVCLDIAEGESFVLYSRKTKAVYDTGRDEVSVLNAGGLQPTWNTFFELMEWYLE